MRETGKERRCERERLLETANLKLKTDLTSGFVKVPHLICAPRHFPRSENLR